MSATSAIDLVPVLAGLNDAQKAAVMNPSAVLQILAPPGSGKTRTLTSRVAFLLGEPQRLKPQNVIVATFTVKAAREMKERISALVGDGIENKLVLGTFHSIARRYLVRYGHLVGLKSGWQIADSGDSLGICKRIVKRRKIPLEPSAVRSRISNFKARNTSPTAKALVPIYAPSTQSTQNKSKDITTDDFVLLYEDYCAALKASNLLDYDDLLLRCVELLQDHPECVSNIEAVLIDEFQDTNLVQLELMKLFSWKRQRITVVGDPDQSIYGFRAAEIRNLQRMLKLYPEALVVHLEENYRSSGAILLASLEVIQQDISRPKKKMTPTHEIGTRPVLRRVPTAGMEAMWIVSEILRIKAMTAGMVNYGDVAILVRSAILTRIIETSLTKAGVGYRMVGGLRFFDRVEVKTVLDYLRVLQNTSNSDALARIINIPPRKIGDTTLKGLVDEADRKKKSLWELVVKGVRGDIRLDTKINKVAEKGLAEFVNVILTTKRLMEEDSEEEKNLVDVVQFLLKKLGYEAYLQRHYPEDWEARSANVQELLVQAQDVGIDEESLPEVEGLEQGDTSTNSLYSGLEKFLVNVALTNGVKEEEDEDEEKFKEGQVTISTIHAAKGLEWPIVFIPGVYEGIIPHSRADDTDEERRLLYVAMTRAQAQLYMSCSMRNSLKEKTTLSQFLVHPPLTPLLDKRGPKLGFTTVQSLALILGRQCPSELELQLAIEKSGIPSILDDQFPEKEAWDSDTDEEGDGEENWERMKRRRLEGEYRHNTLELESGPKGWNSVPPLRAGEQQRSFVGYTRAMTMFEARGGVVDMGAGGIAGFKSASAHMVELNESRSNSEVERARKEHRGRHDQLTRSKLPPTATSQKASDPDPPPKSNAHPAKPKKRPAAGQGSLLKYFQKPAQTQTSHPGTKPPNASDVIKMSGNNLSLREQMEVLPQPKIPQMPQPAPAASAGSRRKAEFILLSSSPVRPPPVKRVKQTQRKEEPEYEPPSSPDFDLFVQSVKEREVAVVDAEATRVRPKAASAGDTGSRRENTVSDKGSGSAASISASRAGGPVPARTVNAASNSNPNSNSSSHSNAKAPVSQKPAQRRTLGIRRSMNGWQNRANK
ncbi:ATP-dependent DNA helicase srs2 [Rhizina undulata]